LDDIRSFYFERFKPVTNIMSRSYFSFNSDGQCPTCRGAGFEKVEMQFLSDIYIRCADCKGSRFRPEVLERKIRPPNDRETAAIRSDNVAQLMRNTWIHPVFRKQTVGNSPDAWSIADMLAATVDNAILWLNRFNVFGEVTIPSDQTGHVARRRSIEQIMFRHAQNALHKLQIMADVGLGYIQLGQPLNTLSGGECQRLKLAAHMGSMAADSSPVDTGGSGTLFLFDEPTTGLHFEDVRILLGAFQSLVDRGHSVVIIEHHPDVIQSADWVLDLGPEAGDRGGQLVAAGPPEHLIKCPTSHTGRFLNKSPGD
jgi:excinuclease ABC subunit A